MALDVKATHLLLRAAVSDLKAVGGPRIKNTAESIEYHTRQLFAEIERLKDEVRVYGVVGAAPRIVEDDNWITWGLTPSEQKILRALKQAGSKGLSKESILSAVNADKPVSDWPEIKIVDVQTCKLRKKLIGANAPYWIETVWGGGYRYRAGVFPAQENTAPDGKVLHRKPSPFYAKHQEYHKSLKAGAIPKDFTIAAGARKAHGIWKRKPKPESIAA